MTLCRVIFIRTAILFQGCNQCLTLGKSPCNKCVTSGQVSALNCFCNPCDFVRGLKLCNRCFWVLFYEKCKPALLVSDSVQCLQWIRQRPFRQQMLWLQRIWTSPVGEYSLSPVLACVKTFHIRLAAAQFYCFIFPFVCEGSDWHVWFNTLFSI